MRMSDVDLTAGYVEFVTGGPAEGAGAKDRRIRVDAAKAFALEDEAAALREQVAHLRAQNESYALDVKMLHEQANSASVMLRMAREQREAEVEDAAATIAALTAKSKLADEAWWGRENTKKQFVALVSVARALGVDADYRKPEDIAAECRVAVERLTTTLHTCRLARHKAEDDNARHLAVIETLRAELAEYKSVNGTLQSMVNEAASNHGACIGCRARKATADYAKKADEVTYPSCKSCGAAVGCGHYDHCATNGDFGGER